MKGVHRRGAAELLQKSPKQCLCAVYLGGKTPRPLHWHDDSTTVGRSWSQDPAAKPHLTSFQLPGDQTVRHASSVARAVGEPPSPHPPPLRQDLRVSGQGQQRVSHMLRELTVPWFHRQNKNWKRYILGMFSS